MSDFITEDMKLAVKKGANWLDLNHPNWAQRINLERFNMNICSMCIIGQAVGEYRATVIEIVGGNHSVSFTEKGSGYIDSIQWGSDHGFEAAGNLSWPEQESYYRKLETLWTEEVYKRLGEN